MNKNYNKIGIIGLGYVGLPIANAFSKNPMYEVMGYDIDSSRILQLKDGYDKTGELQEGSISPSLKFTDSINELKDFNIYIITVPTPIDDNREPDLKPLESACEKIGELITIGNIIIFESTVYPGCTEEFCMPILEKASGLKFNQDFYLGYSPERINPGDKQNTVENIVKVTSGSNKEIGNIVDNLYKSVIKAGTHLASSIKVAEASKAIENAQRDLNISFMNEISIFFDKLGIDTTEVLEAAGTKWNFLPFKPGLVGGHCISVDPYYLLHKANEIGYFPDVIANGRKVNEFIPTFIAQKLINLLVKNDLNPYDSKVLILGITFKENCPDSRNSKVIELCKEIIDFGVEIDIHDPIAEIESITVNDKQIGIHRYKDDLSDNYDAIILAVPNQVFMEDIKNLINRTSILLDLKAVLPKESSSFRL